MYYKTADMGEVGGQKYGKIAAIVYEWSVRVHKHKCLQFLHFVLPCYWGWIILDMEDKNKIEAAIRTAWKDRLAVRLSIGLRHMQ